MGSADDITLDYSIVTALDKADKKLRNKLLRTGMRDAMKIVLAQAKRDAPVESGKLAKSLAVRATKRSRGTIGIMVTTREGLFSGETFYGGFQEYGFHLGKRTSNTDLGIRKGKRRTIAQRSAISALDNARPFISTRPFLRPALDDNKTAIVDKMTATIEAGLAGAGK